MITTRLNKFKEYVLLKLWMELSMEKLCYHNVEFV